MKKRFIYLLLFIFLAMNCDYVHAAVCYKITDTRDNSVIYTDDENYNSHGYGDTRIYQVEEYSGYSCESLQNGINDKTSCGGMGEFNRKIPEITSWIVSLLEIAVPVILVIFGSIDFVKAIVSQKDDEIKKGQQIFIKRLITGIIIFFIVVFTKLLVSAVSGDNNDKKGFIDCIDCFVNNKCK